jgi:hypothetical protein
MLSGSLALCDEDAAIAFDNRRHYYCH